MHSIELWARAAQQDSTAGRSQEETPHVFFLVVVAQHGHKLQAESGRENLPLQDEVVAT